MRSRIVTLAAAAAVVLGGAALVSAEEKKPQGLAALEWLAGSWTSEDAQGAFDEHWLPPRGDSMFAVSRQVSAQGATGMCELSAIETTPDGLVLRIRHFSRALEPWKSDAQGPLTMKCVEQGPRKAVFESDREFPKRITYERKGDELTAALEGTHGGEPAGMTFTLRPTKR